MDDALLVRGFERVRDLFRNGQRLVKRNRAARDALREIVALNEFHDERGNARTFFKPVDGGDMRMIERGEHFRFALKTREPIGISRERGRQDLNRDLTFQPGVRRPIHLAHPAFANLRGDVVNAEACAGCNEQCLRDYTGAAVVRTGLLRKSVRSTAHRPRPRPHRHARCAAWPARARCDEFGGRAVAPPRRSRDPRAHRPAAASVVPVRRAAEAAFLNGYITPMIGTLRLPPDIQESVETDYAFRILVPKQAWRRVVEKLVDEIDYDK